ncbi:DUF2309 domain-containing protein [Putridiphycobacter roseus]|uniref:DUF2309 domain-containing protein n=1 Tax=Putridiphycobacter roseus TaxID=2219161 RepID=A0A2W1NDC8_9FLAO|nr:putative inorganic carbon transporter subunit DabA [Putridiphycobacter roseus]PZE16086.1 DUF2309 domain-containing protein [Putridiphycobacter roseus]
MTNSFNESATLKKISHFLPAQAPLKDFVHHNTLHAFQNLEFFEALKLSANIFGNRTLLALSDYRNRYIKGEITDPVIDSVITTVKGKSQIDHWREKMFALEEPTFVQPRIGNLRKVWQSDYGIDMDGMVRPKLIRLINAYLDQGIAIKGFPKTNMNLLSTIMEVQEHSYAKLFHSKKAIKLLYKKDKCLSDILYLIVGDDRYFEQYLIDQQYTHPGISGMVCAIEKKPDAIYVPRPISLFEFIYLELLLELEALESAVNRNFRPLAIGVEFEPEDIFRKVETNDYWEVLALWQRSFEWMLHDQVLSGIKYAKRVETDEIKTQAFFCMDDREESIRRNIERLHPNCQTFGTPAHFNIIAKFKPENAKFATQICPGPFTPKHLIKELDRKSTFKTDIHFNNNTHGFIIGFIVSQTVGFWSSFKLLLNIFNPKESVGQYNAQNDHMDYGSTLIYENQGGAKEDDLNVGFTVAEMIEMVKGELSNTGLTTGFAPLVYFFGHGGSSTNNPYFAGYNCGACSGRPSSVNARLFAKMANRKDVRKALAADGILIPEFTHFIGGYHDTTQDTFVYFDEEEVPDHTLELHQSNKRQFGLALDMNAKERARQFLLVNTKQSAQKVHEKVKKRALSLFEPRPEYNHSNNALFIVGNRKLTKNLFLDQRAFLNSYDYKSDPDGKLLTNILNAGTGVCGGINLEYLFSTVDNEKLGAGSKLPQNVIGLYAIANGVKGDLRPGLPYQMIDVHDPIRILTVVEQKPEVVLKVLKDNPGTFEWYDKNWMKLTVFNPFDNELYMLIDGSFERYQPIQESIPILKDFEKLIESSSKNLPIHQLN